jgi:D-alanyl-D-alanine carboxypeptidase/D-alanyl-D-alanine-endopeptidase (penicillin-binding protein 4)
VPANIFEISEDQINEMVTLSRADWDNFETSWDFRDQPLLRPMVDLLPIAGGSGTLSNRFVGGDLVKSPTGWLRAKTGSLTKTNSLAGIVTDASGRVLTFAFISNNAGIEGRTAIDALAAVLRTCGCSS